MPSHFLGAGVAFGFFFWHYILSRGRWITVTDIMIGTFLGFVFGWNSILIVAALGYGLAALVSLIQLIIFRSKSTRCIPLSIFLCLSGIIFFMFNFLWQR